MPLPLMPDYIYQQFSAAGKPLSGGTVYFYQSETFTPKTVYADAAGTVPLGTSVTLSAAGTAVIFLDSGAYRIWIKDSTGVQVAPWVDGIVGGAATGSTGTNATFGLFKVYNDVRALTGTPPDFVYVTGGTTEGDGGAGWFQLQPGSVLTDDGGILLTAASGSIVYRRVFDAAIDPQWYGVVYAINADQTYALNLALSASAAQNFPVLVTRSVYIVSNIVVPAGAMLETTLDGFFTAPGAVTITFSDGSRFDGQGVTFGTFVQPLFGVGVCEAIRLSWMGGSIDYTRWVKLIAATTKEYNALVDISTIISQDIVTPLNLAMDWSDGALLTINGAINLTIKNLTYIKGLAIIHFTNPAWILSVSIGAENVLPEWFGAIGDGATDDYAALFAAAMSGKLFLSDGKVYFSNTAWPSFPTPLEISGNGTLKLGTGRTLGTGALSLDRCTITLVTPETWFAGTLLEASDAAFPSTYTATTKIVSGCVYTDYAYSPMFDGNPTLKNARLPLLPSTQFLGVDSLGKVIATPNNPLVLANVQINDIFANSITPIVGFGSVHLTEPLNMIQMVQNTYVPFDLYLPDLTGVSGSNLLFLITTGMATITLHCTTINNAGSLGPTMTFNRPLLLYFDVYSHTWYVISVN